MVQNLYLIDSSPLLAYVISPNLAILASRSTSPEGQTTTAGYSSWEMGLAAASTVVTVGSSSHSDSSRKQVDTAAASATAVTRTHASCS